MKINIITIFPNLYDSFLSDTFVKKAIDSKILEINLIDPRNYSLNKHKKVDDYVYGGSEGMLLMCQPLFDAVEANNLQPTHKIMLTPSGNQLTQSKMKELSSLSEITLTCGRYEGVDQRYIDTYIDEEISIGDYITLGGEIPSMIIIEGITRLLDGVLQNPNSVQNESFENDLLEPPRYTRPAKFRELQVPEVLISGHHAKIVAWETKMSKLKTSQKNSLQKKKFSIIET